MMVHSFLYELSACNFRHGDDTQLLHHAEIVKETPTLGNLSIHNSVYDYPTDSGGLTGRGEALEFALMRAVSCPARQDLLPFGELFINREMNVWEGITVHRDGLFGTFGARRRLGRSAWATVDMVLGDNLV